LYVYIKILSIFYLYKKIGVLNVRRCKINEFINKITYNTKYDELKKKQIKILIYNNRDKLTKEIYQDLDIIV
jgi:hypothetical protein